MVPVHTAAVFDKREEWTFQLTGSAGNARSLMPHLLIWHPFSHNKCTYFLQATNNFNFNLQHVDKYFRS